MKKWIKKAPEPTPAKTEKQEPSHKKPSATAMRGKMYGKD